LCSCSLRAICSCVSKCECIRVVLGRAVDQVRTSSPTHIAADASTAHLQFAVEVDASCSGAPNPNYYLYPMIADLYRWSAIDPAFWYLAGFAPAQTGPPYWYQNCFSPDICPVSYGVASIKNFVDFADFADLWLPYRGVPYRDVFSEPFPTCQPGAAGRDRKIMAQVFGSIRSSI
jgi:hypothetical protein